MKVSLVIRSMGCGGSERVLSSIANHLAQCGWQVTLITLNQKNVPPHYQNSFYPLHEKVQHLNLGGPFGEKYQRNAPVQRPSYLPLETWQQCTPEEREILVWEEKRIILLKETLAQSQPDVILSFIYKNNIRSLLAGLCLDIPVMVSDRGDPEGEEPLAAPGWARLRRRLYPQARFIVSISEAITRTYTAPMAARVVILTNPVFTPPGQAQPTQLRKTLLGIGRLAWMKGCDLLLEAFALLADPFPDWDLWIYGNGPYQQEWTAQAASMGLADRAFFPGTTSEVGNVMRTADIFVCPSRAESFGNALAEAMAVGMPVVSFDCPSGPRHLIRHGETGLLVEPENVSALAAALGRLMKAPVHRQALGKAAQESMQAFEPGPILLRWEQLFRDAVQLV